MVQKKSKVYFTSPSGIAQYPWLTTPDTQFNPDGVYQTNLVFDSGVSDDLIKQITETATDHFGDLKNVKMPFFSDPETGHMVIKIKSKYAPVFWDSSLNVLVGEQIPNVWGGSKIKVGGTISCFTISGSKSVSLRMHKVQLINVVSGGSASNNADGFEVSEGGFIAADIKAEDIDLETASGGFHHDEEKVEAGDF